MGRLMHSQRERFLTERSQSFVPSESKLSHATWAVERPLKDLYSVDTSCHRDAIMGEDLGRPAKLIWALLLCCSRHQKQ